jgi:hypothetical protein
VKIMSRRGVLALAVVVIGGLGALWYFGFRDDGTRAAPAAPVPVTAPEPGATAPAPATGPAPALPGAPVAPGSSGEPAAPVTKLESTKRSGSAAAPPSTDGLEVRDHRAAGGAGTGSGAAGGITAQKDTAGDPPPIQPGQLHPTVSRALHADRRAAILECATLIQPSDRGTRPRIGAKLVLAVAGGALRVVEVEPVLVDVTGADIPAAKQCVRDALMGVELPAPDTPESDTVAFDVSYAIR